ncbi:MAG: class I SAM-dependent methyltransferase [Janthinobacterium lividum]
MFNRRGRGGAGGSRTEVAANQFDGIAEVRESGLFDGDWYLAHNPDVAAVGADPLLHYLASGAAEGRSPGPRFDVTWYLGETPEAGLPGINPILHYLREGRGLGRTPRALDDGQAFDSLLAGTRSGRLPFAEAVRSGVDHVHYALDATRSAAARTGLPLPPPELSVRIGSPTLEGFEEIGQGVKQTIVRCLPTEFDFRGSRCLDFGCGIGRVIRQFAEEARSAEFWGCDIDGTSIRWAVENMTPPFRFYRMSQAPSLPFEDSSFDLIYAIAVFSQVYDDWHQWAVEIRRVLKPGGVFFMSYAGQTPFEEMLSLPYDGFDPHPGLYVKNPFNSWNRGGPMVFMSPAWVERHWGSLFDIDFVAPDALLDYQSICVMRKPERGAPPRMGMRTVKTGTSQPFNRDATGRIAQRCDGAKPFLDSYGIDTAGDAEVEGWIVLRGDTPERLTVLVDGTPVQGRETIWEPGNPYRDWAESRQTAFRTSIGTDRIAAGTHELTVEIQGSRGVSHAMKIPLLKREALSNKPGG